MEISSVHSEGEENGWWSLTEDYLYRFVCAWVYRKYFWIFLNRKYLGGHSIFAQKAVCMCVSEAVLYTYFSGSNDWIFVWSCFLQILPPTHNPQSLTSLPGKTEFERNGGMVSSALTYTWIPISLGAKGAMREAIDRQWNVEHEEGRRIREIHSRLGVSVLRSIYRALPEISPRKHFTIFA